MYVHLNYESKHFPDRWPEYKFIKFVEALAFL